MKKEKVELLKWVDDKIHPKALNKSFLPEEFLIVRLGFANQIRLYRETVHHEEPPSQKYVHVRLIQLIDMSNTIWFYLHRMSFLWNRKEAASHIRSIYLQALDALEGLINDFQKTAPTVCDRLPLTLFSLSGERMKIRALINQFSLHLRHSNIDKKLTEILKNEFDRFIWKKDICRKELNYTTYLMNSILFSLHTDDRSMIQLLYGHGFNSKDFFHYYATGLNNKLDEVPSLHNELEIIISEQDILNSIPRSSVQMIPQLSPIDSQIFGFLKSKEKHIKEVLNLRRRLIEEGQLTKTANRLKIYLPVAQFGLLIRLHIEKGLLGSDNIGALFTFFASHFSTPQTPVISAESLRKKSTDVEFSSAQKLKAHIIGMLNWLNEHYNLSNFKDS